MEHYLAHTDYPIWEVIQRGNGPVSVSIDTNGVIKVLPPKTAKEILARERERKARTTLLMALPEDHLAKFHKITDAKEMWEAIKSRFGGNDESKKMQKYILKQQFEGFFISNSEGLHKGYDRFQSLLSQLEIHGVGVSTKDANQKFLRSLSSAWSQVSLIMRTKPGVDSLSFDDLYNNLRVFESDVKGSTASSSSNQNVAFVSENTSSTNEVSTAYGVSNSSGHNSQSEHPSSYSFLANQSSCPQLDHEDLEQLDEFDLEEMDLKWQVAMISMRMKKFYKKTGRKLQFDAKEPVGFDKTKVECYNCHKTGHFARECRSKGNQDSRRRDAWNTGNKDKDNGRRSGKQEESKALVTLDGEGVDWTSHSEDEQENYALMAYSSSGSDTEMSARDKARLRSSDIEDSPMNNRYAEGMHAVPPPMTGIYIPYGPNKEIDDLQFTYGTKQSKPSESDARSSDLLLMNPILVKKHMNLCLNQLSMNPKYFSHLIRDCDFHEKRMAKQAEVNKRKLLTRTGKIQVNTARASSTNNVNTVRASSTKDVSTARHNFNSQAIPTNAARKVNTVKPIVNNDYPQRYLKNKGIVDSGCSRHMTGNKAHLAEYQDYNGGPVAFGGSKGYITGKGKIKTGKLDFEDVCFVKELQHFNLFSVSQICDKKNKVLFTDTECLVLSPDFKLPDENQVLLRVPRQNNMYSFNLENIVPSRGLACLITKATVDESNKWNRRLGHKGKQHKASYKAKSVSSISQPLQLLHMDLFGPTSGKNFLRNVTPLFDSMLVQPTKDEGEASKRPSESQPIPSPPHPSEDQPKSQPDPSLRPSPSIPIPDSNLEGSGGNHGGQSSSDRSLSRNEDGLALQSVYDLCISLCKQVTIQAKEIKDLKAHIKKLMKKARRGRKTAKSKLTSHKDQAFDDLDDFGAMDYMETHDAHNQKGVSTEDQVSTVKPDEGTDKPKVSTDKIDEGINELKNGNSDENATPTATPTVFGDDETIAEFLVSMSQNKAKQKGFEIKDAEDSNRPRPTSTRSLLTLKPLPKIDPKDKGKKVLEEEAEFDAESEGVNEAERRFAQLANDEETAKKVQEEWETEEKNKKLQEEEREKFTIEERAKLLHDTIDAQRRILTQQRAVKIKSRPPTRTQLRNQMMTYLKHVRGKKHYDLKTKNFEEIQVLYEKEKRSDENFIAIGSAEDERRIKDVNKKATGINKDDNIKEESKEEETTDEDKEVDYEILDKKYPIIEWKTEYLGTKPQYQDEIPEGFDRVLWGDLMIMFNPSDKDEFWNSRYDWNVYPLRRKVLLQMLELKLESEEDSTMALELIRFVKKLIAELEPEDSYGNEEDLLVKSWLVQDQTVPGKDKSNLLIADSLLKTRWLSMHHVMAMKHRLVQKQTAFGKDKSNPLIVYSKL
ncbi:ribonuclease H-like domain-containing protein [Tanacetum coccineum]